MEIVERTLRETLRRVEAVAAGGPLTRYETVHIRRHENPLLISFVRMTGLNTPWAAVYGRAQDESPKVSFAYDPRDPKQVAGFAEDLAKELLDYFGVEGFSSHPLRSATIRHEDMPQLWVADQANLEMIHNLSYRFYEPRTSDGFTMLGFFGRLCTFIFEHSTVTGHQLVVNASELLANLFVIPAGDHFANSLPSALAWVRSGEGINQTRFSAIRSLDLASSVTLDPDLENTMVEQIWSQAVGSELSTNTKALIETTLRPELARRWDILKSAWLFALADTRDENRFVGDLVTDSLLAYKRDFLNAESERELEENVPSRGPETDNDPTISSLHYLRALEAEDKFVSYLVHDDRELLADVFFDGTGFMSVVRQVEQQPDGSCIWRVELDEKFGRLMKKRENEHFRIIGNPRKNPEAAVTAFTKHPKGLNLAEAENWVVELSFSSSDAMRIPQTTRNDIPPISDEWVGATVIFVPSFAEHLHEAAQSVVKRAANRAGGWLFRRALNR